MNYFEIFNLKPSFEVDLDGLEAAYLKEQAKVHPDKMKNLGASDQLVYLQQSARVNDAYACLKNEVKRAVYLLDLSGHPDVLKSNDNTSQEMLIRQMELRERMIDGDLQNVKIEVKQDMSSIIVRLHKAFEEKNFDLAKNLTVELQFMKRIERELKEKQKR